MIGTLVFRYHLIFQRKAEQSHVVDWLDRGDFVDPDAENTTTILYELFSSSQQLMGAVGRHLSLTRRISVLRQATLHKSSS